MPSTTDTTDLLGAAQRGDAAALEALFARCAPAVRRIVALRLRRPLSDLDVDDFVQEALLHALLKLEDFEQRSEGSFRNWLAVIVQNKLIDAERRANRNPTRNALRLDGETLTESLFPDSVPSPSEEAMRHEQEAKLEELLHELENPYLEVLTMRVFAGMPYSEIADKIGRREDTCRQIHKRALDKLRARCDWL